MQSLNFLMRSHIADLLGVDDKTVSDYLHDSKPGGKYADDPVPEPMGYLDARAPEGWVEPAGLRPGLRPIWSPDSRAEWQRWRANHPGRDRRRTPSD
jgi:hypothetical protein